MVSEVTLPALLTTSIPFEAATSAPLVMKGVSPSMSLKELSSAGSSKVKYPSDDVIMSAPALSAYSAAATQ